MSARGALDKFLHAVTVAPVGVLHLERIEMSPAGVERGELVATIPLAPAETTSVTQKEWAVTNEEFSTIVTDSLDNYSEKGVSEKSDLADSTESQTKHSQQLGLNASLSGSYGFVTFSTSGNFSSTSSDDETKKASRSHATDVTSKASSRVRKERKVTIQTSSATGSEQTSTRTLTNPSSTAPMRIDYFSMMRKWQVRLLQYGVRMTYDIVIPEPGATLRGAHAELAALEAELSEPFVFSIGPSEVEPYDSNSPNFYASLANQYGVAVSPPKVQTPASPQFVTTTLTGSTDGSWPTDYFEFDIDEGYEVTAATLVALLSYQGGGTTAERFLYMQSIGFIVEGNGSYPQANSTNKTLSNSPNVFGEVITVPFDTKNKGGLVGQTGHQKLPWRIARVLGGSLSLTMSLQISADWLLQWQQQAWQALHDAARDAYYANAQAKATRRDVLKAQIDSVDTLTLRREEREEVMKGVLRWLLGPDFHFMPQEVVDLFTAALNKKVDPDSLLQHGETFTGSDLDLPNSSGGSEGWTLMLAYGEMIKFIMEAIEWENLLYLVYPYFWDVPAAWDFVRTLEHPDSTREAFLRGGSARVVLTTSFIDLGDFQTLLPQDHPYFTIADEIQAYSQTNYPGIPPANPELSYRPLLTPLQRRAWQTMQAIMRLLERFSSITGAYPTTTEGLAALAKLIPPTLDPWGNPYQYDTQSPTTDYSLSTFGADGLAGGSTGDDVDLTTLSVLASPSVLEQKALQDLQTIASFLEAYKLLHGAYPTAVQGLSALTPLPSLLLLDPWGNAFKYASPGHYNDYDLSSLGANGVPGGDGEDGDIASWVSASLIGEWYEYTPTHGLDIAVTSPASDLS